ncbi:5'-methylthioadenosine/adenosylhomocysteine nucleosidase [Marininema halotolerans]|uniref:adenosylhomocysteine nucleosidase n=1 Tax=Marininema halotolerans TaxID=1155944 RepID=A0A1I6U981_9BACL|nr:5'-methylthioadenosine/adenosylhomocysteine nucleosidase [Marininema halotolerans]SFS98000.1 adenosylhomocysteine nucleosidase [Marininema halotolerans]
MIIGIIGPSMTEIALLLREMKIEKKFTIAKTLFFKGMLRGVKVVVCRSRDGKVNAGLATRELIARFGAKSIILNGVAGAINPNLRILDVVISTGTQFHDVNYTRVGVPLSEYPNLRIAVYQANPPLVRLAQQSAKKQPYIRATTGKILTGDQFIASPIRKYLLRKVFHGEAVESEGAGVGQASFLNHTPYVVIRSVSDLANRVAPIDFRILVRLAAINAQRVTLGVLDELNNKRKYIGSRGEII